MKEYKKIFAICFLIFAGMLLFLWGFLIFTANIPNAKIQNNMIKSALAHAQEEAFPYCDGDKMNGIADNYADSIWLNVAWHMGEGTPVSSTLNTKYYNGEVYGENIGLYLAVTDESIEPNTDYTRYWHGTAGIIRILHLFTDISGIKTAGLVFAIVLSIIIMVLLIKDKNGMLAAAFALSLCVIKVWNIRLSMEYQPAFIICFLMCILYLLFEKKGDRYLLYLSVAGGVLVAFFDFLTTETMVILLPLILVITVRASNGKNSSFMKNARFVAVQLAVWLMAYASSFLAKWSAASLYTRENKFMAAMQSVEKRVNGSLIGGEEMSKLEQVFAAPAANISVLLGSSERIEMPLLIIGVLLAVGAVLMGIFLFPSQKENRSTMWILLLVGSLVIVRYIVLSNHSYLHAFFTYRGLISPIMALLSIMIIRFKRGNSLSNDNPV